MSLSLKKLAVLGTIALVGIATVGALTADGRLHRHSLSVKQYYVEATVPAESGGVPGVEGAVVFCPPGRIATGGGAGYRDGVLYLVENDIYPDSATVIYINEYFAPGAFTVTVACVKGRTGAARGKSPTRAQVRAELDRQVAEIRSQLEAAE